MKAEIYRELRRTLAEERLVALAIVLDGPEAGRQLLVWPDRALGGLGSDALDRAAAEAARELFADFRSERRRLPTPDGEVDVFLEVHPPRPRLVVVGAVHAAIHLARFAEAMGFRTVVVDPRTAFATRERFADASELSTEWPDEALRRLGVNENTYAALLSHDLKLDLPALEVLLRSPARYVGALGSRKTHQKRVRELEARGFTAAEIGRIKNPIGLDLGGRRAEEIALSIIAEMVAVAHGRTLVAA